jgi:hypothetical protein
MADAVESRVDRMDIILNRLREYALRYQTLHDSEDEFLSSLKRLRRSLTSMCDPESLESPSAISRENRTAPPRSHDYIDQQRVPDELRAQGRAFIDSVASFTAKVEQKIASEAAHISFLHKKVVELLHHTRSCDLSALSDERLEDDYTRPLKNIEQLLLFSGSALSNASSAYRPHCQQTAELVRKSTLQFFERPHWRALQRVSNVVIEEIQTVSSSLATTDWVEIKKARQEILQIVSQK